MKQFLIIITYILLVVGCKKPFSKTTETALALPTSLASKSTSVVFIAGYDEGDNTYYSNAKTYFKGQNKQVIDNLFSVEEIISWLNHNSALDQTYAEIHIVSHSNPWLGMSLKTKKDGERVTVKTLKATKTNTDISALETGVSNTTKIIFHSCGLGQNKDLLHELQQTFTAETAPKVYASSFFNVFGGKYAPHYLAKPYYNFYPTAESPGPATLAKEFKEKYKTLEIDWRSAMKNRRETSLGEAYSYKFNIPIEWEFTFDAATEMPNLSDREAIMDWVSASEMAETLYQLNIPLEKYRWRSEIHGNTLIIKGKTTVLCILKPILDQTDKNEYQNTNAEDRFLYQIL